MESLSKKLLDYLTVFGKGPDNAIKISFLSKRLEEDERTIRNLTEVLREAGHPICGGDNGIFLARNIKDALPWIRRMDSQIKKMCIHKNQVWNALKLTFGEDCIQEELLA